MNNPASAAGVSPVMRVVLYPWLALLAVACSITGPDRDAHPLARLIDARERWEASGIASYELVMRRLCGECPPEAAFAVVVAVDAGSRSVSLAENGEPVGTDLLDLYPDVEGLFALIEDALVAGIAEVDVEYDPVLGFPREVAIDAVPDAIDDEFGYVIEDLVAGRHAALRVELAAQRAKWTASGIRSYQLTLRRTCFCGPGAAGIVLVNVLEGEPVEWLYFLTGEPVAEELRPSFPDVDGLFDFVEEAIGRGAESIEITFDPELGVPQELVVDFRLAAADEEIGYGVEKIVPIDDGLEPPPAR